MKLGFSTLGCPQWTVDQVISMATQCGYDGVEIRMIRGEVLLHNLEEFQPHNIKATHKKFRHNNLEVMCISTSVRFNSADAEERAKQLENAQRNIDIATGLGARYLRVFGGPIPENQDPQETKERIVEGLSRMTELATQQGVMVLLETHDSFSTGRQALELLSAVDNLGILWDILHSYRHGESFNETFEQVGELIRHVHFKDSATYSPSGFDLRLLGEGTLPIAEALNVLQKNGYSDYINFEWEKAWHPEIEEPEVALPHYVAAMRRLLD